MRSANTKDIFRQIRCCPRRFIAILSIVALGVAFFAGVRASSPDMRLTLDRYYDDQNASDIRLLSTMGFSGEDIDALEEEFDIVQPGYMLDAFAEISGKERLLHLTSYDLDAGSSLLNQPALTEGRLPSAEDECVADQILIDSFGLRVGDTITLRSDDSDVTDNLSRYSCTVVGAARSVQYISCLVYTSITPNPARLPGFFAQGGRGRLSRSRSLPPAPVKSHAGAWKAYGRNRA